MEEIKKDVREIRSILTENTFRLAEYNAELRVHIRGTEDLRARVKPLEEHAAFQRHLFKIFMWAVGMGAAIASISRLLK